jgi:hypothetical protein
VYICQETANHQENTNEPIEGDTNTSYAKKQLRRRCMKAEKEIYRPYAELIIERQGMYGKTATKRPASSTAVQRYSGTAVRRDKHGQQKDYSAERYGGTKGD